MTNSRDNAIFKALQLVYAPEVVFYGLICARKPGQHNGFELLTSKHFAIEGKDYGLFFYIGKRETDASKQIARSAVERI